MMTSRLQQGESQEDSMESVFTGQASEWHTSHSVGQDWVTRDTPLYKETWEIKFSYVPRKEGHEGLEEPIAVSAT